MLQEITSIFEKLFLQIGDGTQKNKKQFFAPMKHSVSSLAEKKMLKMLAVAGAETRQYCSTIRDFS